MNDSFLLNTEFAERLYSSVSGQPIIDWHNHLDVSALRSDRKFSNLTELWISSDPYKHRAMRICGVPEHLITGDVSPWEKFKAWSDVLPRLLGNPLYHWSHLELRRVFSIEEELTPASAERIWTEANALLSGDEYSSRSLLRRFHVQYAAPCVTFADFPLSFDFMDGIVPSFRGDSAVDIDCLDIASLSSCFQCTIQSLEDWQDVFRRGVEALHRSGCRFADHALDSGFVYIPDDGRNGERFRRFLDHDLPESEKAALTSCLLFFAGKEYSRLHWTMQLHIGAMRRTSTRLRRAAGPAGGYAGIASPCDIASISSFLNDLESSSSGLPPVILYTLNPADLADLAVLSGSFCEDNFPGKVQLGPAWWYCDHLYGMRMCFENIASFGVLSTFLGMTTDSRSLLSFVRHEYFRRCFCNWLGEKVVAGEMPDDFHQLQALAKAVCGGNAAGRIHLCNK